jgi:hypothetical protein
MIVTVRGKIKRSVETSEARCVVNEAGEGCGGYFEAGWK